MSHSSNRTRAPAHVSDPSAAEEIAANLARPQAAIAPKYFYDPLGSKLFEAICELEEYYLTRTEAALFAAHGADIARASGPQTCLIDLGAGNCAKAASLFSVLRPSLYVPVDISAAFLHDAVEGLRRRFPTLPIEPLGMDFSEFLNLPAAIRGRSRKLFFYPGSSLGNFSPLQAAQFLQRIRAQEGELLLGIDLAKDAAVLEAAYDDAPGVTAAFNRNILRHVNRLLGSDFAPRAWAHVALFNAAQSRVEMHLRAESDLLVRWPGGERKFARGETIHTENSYKYSQAAVLEMLRQSGFGEITAWCDAGENYMLCHARPV